MNCGSVFNTAEDGLRKRRLGVSRQSGLYEEQCCLAAWTWATSWAKQAVRHTLALFAAHMYGAALSCFGQGGHRVAEWAQVDAGACKGE